MNTISCKSTKKHGLVKLQKENGKYLVTTKQMEYTIPTNDTEEIFMTAVDAMVYYMSLN